MLAGFQVVIPDFEPESKFPEFWIPTLCLAEVHAGRFVGMTSENNYEMVCN